VKKELDKRAEGKASEVSDSDAENDNGDYGESDSEGSD